MGNSSAHDGTTLDHSVVIGWLWVHMKGPKCLCSCLAPSGEDGWEAGLLTFSLSSQSLSMVPPAGQLTVYMWPQAPKVSITRDNKQELSWHAQNCLCWLNHHKSAQIQGKQTHLSVGPSLICHEANKFSPRTTGCTLNTHSASTQTGPPPSHTH